jgi:RimJ/RimL family protein N-acetyltransferase
MGTDPIVFRSGDRIYLGPILKEDLPAVTVWINDPEVSQFLEVSAPMTLQDEEKWLANLSDKRASDAVFSIRLKETNESIGHIGLHRINFKDRVAMAGSFIGRKDLWGKGYGSEALMLLLEYAFNTLDLHKVSAEVYSFNPRSKRCLEKCGFVVEGLQKEHRYRRGRRVDVHLLAAFRKTFFPIWGKYRKGFLGKK